MKAVLNLYKIAMFANMNRVTIKTLRYYDDQKLLVPVYVDEENLSSPVLIKEIPEVIVCTMEQRSFVFKGDMV